MLDLNRVTYWLREKSDFSINKTPAYHLQYTNSNHRIDKDNEISGVLLETKLTFKENSNKTLQKVEKITNILESLMSNIRGAGASQRRILSHNVQKLEIGSS